MKLNMCKFNAYHSFQKLKEISLGRLTEATPISLQCFVTHVLALIRVKKRFHEVLLATLKIPRAGYTWIILSLNSELVHVNESFNYNKKAVIGAQTGGVRDVPESISGDDSPSALIKLMAEWNNACEMRVGPIVPAFSTWMIWFALIKDDRHKCKCVASWNHKWIHSEMRADTVVNRRGMQFGLNGIVMVSIKTNLLYTFQLIKFRKQLQINLQKHLLHQKWKIHKFSDVRLFYIRQWDICIR